MAQPPCIAGGTGKALTTLLRYRAVAVADPKACLRRHVLTSRSALRHRPLPLWPPGTAREFMVHSPTRFAGYEAEQAAAAGALGRRPRHHPGAQGAPVISAGSGQASESGGSLFRCGFSSSRGAGGHGQRPGLGSWKVARGRPPHTEIGAAGICVPRASCPCSSMAKMAMARPALRRLRDHANSSGKLAGEIRLAAHLEAG